MQLIFIIVWAARQLTVLAKEQYYIPHSPYNVVCQHQYEWYYLPDAVQYYPPPPKRDGDFDLGPVIPVPQRAVTDFGHKPPHKPKAPIKPGQAMKLRSSLEIAESSDLEKPSAGQETESVSEAAVEYTTVESMEKTTVKEKVGCTTEYAKREE